jgi:hypothetical protein
VVQRLLILAVLLIACLSAWGQTSETPLQNCQKVTKELIWAAHPDYKIYPVEICSVIVAYMGPSDWLVSEPFGDGSFAIGSASGVKQYYLPPAMASQVALRKLRDAIDTMPDLQLMTPKNNAPSDYFQDWQRIHPRMLSVWTKLREVYCFYHPSGTYIDLQGREQACFEVPEIQTEAIVRGYFASALEVENDWMDAILRAAEARTARMK